MERFLNVEIERQEYMEMRYKVIDEEQYKQGDDLFDYGITDKFEKKEKDEKEEKNDPELKTQEEVYNAELKKLFDDIGN